MFVVFYDLRTLFLAHISFMWGDDGKIAAEYHMYDTSQMVASIEVAQAAAMME